MFENIAFTLLVYLSPALLLLLGWLGLKAKNLIDLKIKNESIKGMVGRLSEVAETSVKAVFQAFVDPLKKDGKFTDQDKAIAKQMALEEIKSHLGEKGLKEIMYVLGWKEEDADKNLSTTIESKVADLKK